MKPTQPLHQHDRRLRHDSDRFHGNYQQNDRDEPEKHEGQKSGYWFHLVAPSEIGADYISEFPPVVDKAVSTISAAAKMVSSANGRPAICTPIGSPSFDFPAGIVTTGRLKTLNVCA